MLQAPTASRAAVGHADASRVAALLLGGGDARRGGHAGTGPGGVPDDHVLDLTAADPRRLVGDPIEDRPWSALGVVAAPRSPCGRRPGPRWPPRVGLERRADLSTPNTSGTATGGRWRPRGGRPPSPRPRPRPRPGEGAPGAPVVVMSDPPAAATTIVRTASSGPRRGAAGSAAPVGCGRGPSD